MRSGFRFLQCSPPIMSGLGTLLFVCLGFWLAPMSVHSIVQAIVRPADTTHISAHQPGLPTLASTVPARLPAPHVDCSRVACLALTFDDGPNPITTPRILDVLERDHVPASFFVVGSRIHGQERTLRRMYYDGGEIGNHSWSHPDLTALNSTQIASQISQTQAAVMGAGVPAPTLFRPPYGAVNAQVRAGVPMTIAMWNGDPLDWKETNVDKVVASIVGQAKPGGVLDMHDIYGATVEAIGPAIDQLKTKYTFVTFSQLFNLQPGQRGEYFGR